MKASFLMLDGLSQVVLTPECEAETKLLGLLHRTGHTVTVHSGEFRVTRGGFIREFGNVDRISGTPPADTMLVLRPAEPPKPDGPSLTTNTMAAEARHAVMSAALPEEVLRALTVPQISATRETLASAAYSAVHAVAEGV